MLIAPQTVATANLHRSAGRLPESGMGPIYDGAGDPEAPISVSLLRLASGSSERFQVEGQETAAIVLSGAGELRAGSASAVFRRPSWIDRPPTVAHASGGTAVEVHADEPSELIVIRTPNPQRFESRVVPAARVREEQRGRGKVFDAAHRLVRTAFDGSDSPPATRLVIGEVITFPGRWSSYPPHHHPQPELYYYRFDRPQGYGHAECGDEVYKVREHDVLRIPGGKDHAQCAAPGYHMYYLWAIRHLDGARYAGFETTPDHRWTFE
ncbi:MAG TPA: 5-deoxy-glucuronate isomerase [Gemmatimonadales bacterium]|nr:5-deoxy-glucuronate isomerase [Gemmatimonadales bacterium]